MGGTELTINGIWLTLANVQQNNRPFVEFA